MIVVYRGIAVEESSFWEIKDGDLALYLCPLSHARRVSKYCQSCHSVNFEDNSCSLRGLKRERIVIMI